MIIFSTVEIELFDPFEGLTCTTDEDLCGDRFVAPWQIVLELVQVDLVLLSEVLKRVPGTLCINRLDLAGL